MRWKTAAGTLMFDRPRFAWPLLASPKVAARHWTKFRNRGERLVGAPEPGVFDCAWKWTTDLNLAREFPSLGRRLLDAARTQWPIRLAEAPLEPRREPEISFIVGHRGLERLPHLRMTLASLFAQESVAAEWIVVEHDTQPRLGGLLPPAVQTLFIRAPEGDAYSRSATFNTGARAARGRILVFHDNDTLAPAAYGKETVRRHRAGFLVARLQRYFFYLDERSTASFLSSGGTWERIAVDGVRQNCEGGTIAADRATFFDIGGFDEGFVGWGGEDNEFFDRARTVRHWPFGYLPFVHLWHRSSPEKPGRAARNDYFSARMAISAGRRIVELRGALESRKASR